MAELTKAIDKPPAAGPLPEDPVITGCADAWTARDGTVLPVLRWLPAGPGAVRAVVVAVHGLSGAALDFEPLGAALPARGFAVCALELRGQGNDPVVARRGDVADLGVVVDDLVEFVAGVRGAFPGRPPVFLYGESMGAMLSLHAAAGPLRGDEPGTTTGAGAPGEPPLAGLVLASPVVDFQSPLNWWQHRFFDLFRLLVPRRRLSLEDLGGRHPATQPAPRMTRDGIYDQYLRRAPHHVATFSVRFLHALFTSIKACGPAAARVRAPTLVLYAGHDVFITPALVEGIFERLGAPDKQRRLFPDSYHLLLQDRGRDEVLDLLASWLERRIGPPTAPVKS